jgi:hypothetical protein
MIADGRVHRKAKATSAGSVNGAAHLSRLHRPSTVASFDVLHAPPPTDRSGLFGSDVVHEDAA